MSTLTIDEAIEDAGFKLVRYGDFWTRIFQFFKEGGRRSRPPSLKNWVYYFLEISYADDFVILAKSKSRIEQECIPILQ